LKANSLKVPGNTKTHWTKQNSQHYSRRVKDIKGYLVSLSCTTVAMHEAETIEHLKHQVPHSPTQST